MTCTTGRPTDVVCPAQLAAARTPAHPQWPALAPQLEDVAKYYCDSKCETYEIVMTNVLINANFFKQYSYSENRAILTCSSIGVVVSKSTAASRGPPCNSTAFWLMKLGTDFWSLKRNPVLDERKPSFVEGQNPIIKIR